jgi:hypothetical protein
MSEVEGRGKENGGDGGPGQTPRAAKDYFFFLAGALPFLAGDFVDFFVAVFIVDSPFIEITTT